MTVGYVVFVVCGTACQVADSVSLDEQWWRLVRVSLGQLPTDARTGVDLALNLGDVDICAWRWPESDSGRLAGSCTAVVSAGSESSFRARDHRSRMA